MVLSDITPLVLTFNEAPNIGRTLDSLLWADRIVVLDSFSTDGTVELCRRYRQVVVVQRAFDNHANQWNAGLELISTPWVLSLDADYVLTDGLAREFEQLADADADGYLARFIYCVLGQPLRASLYPPVLVLFRRARARYVQEGHTQRLRLDGPTRWLEGRVRHDDRKALDRWFVDQCRYSALEAAHLRQAPPGELSVVDRIRRLIVLAPLLVLPYVLIGRCVLLDGRAGWFYAGQRMVSEVMLSLRLLEYALRDSDIR